MFPRLPRPCLCCRGWGGLTRPTTETPRKGVRGGTWRLSRTVSSTRRIRDAPEKMPAIRSKRYPFGRSPHIFRGIGYTALTPRWRCSPTAFIDELIFLFTYGWGCAAFCCSTTVLQYYCTLSTFSPNNNDQKQKPLALVATVLLSPRFNF